MHYQSFAQINGLRPGDVIVVPKSQFNLVAHYVVYWGKFYGQDYYLENNDVMGVRWINEAFFVQDNTNYKRFRRFEGSDNDRIIAINRATSLLGNRYDLETFNCENYANYVQYGVSYSKQVDNVKGALTLGGIALGLIALVNVSKK